MKDSPETEKSDLIDQKQLIQAINALQYLRRIEDRRYLGDLQETLNSFKRIILIGITVLYTVAFASLLFYFQGILPLSSISIFIILGAYAAVLILLFLAYRYIKNMMGVVEELQEISEEQQIHRTDIESALFEAMAESLSTEELRLAIENLPDNRKSELLRYLSEHDDHPESN